MEVKHGKKFVDFANSSFGLPYNNGHRDVCGDEEALGKR
jgi:hypothetical protein